MTEEERQAVQATLSARLEEAVMLSDSFWNSVEAKLSPKHPPKGQPCEVWHDGALERNIAFANGGGTFAWTTECYGNMKFDHYRVIPTAEDALVVAQDPTVWQEFGEDMASMRIAQGRIVNRIKGLIDYAMEG